jgi:hypothetical protein
MAIEKVSIVSGAGIHIPFKAQFQGYTVVIPEAFVAATKEDVVACYGEGSIKDAVRVAGLPKDPFQAALILSEARVVCAYQDGNTFYLEIVRELYPEECQTILDNCGVLI